MKALRGAPKARIEQSREAVERSGMLNDRGRTRRTKAKGPANGKERGEDAETRISGRVSQTNEAVLFL